MVDAILFSVILSYSLFVGHTRDMVGSSLELQYFLDFCMTIFWDSLHMAGILFSMKHLLSISSIHLEPILFSCATKT